MEVLLKLDLVCADVYHSVYCSVICKQPQQGHQLLWQVINVGQEETGAKNGPLRYSWSDSGIGGAGTVDNNCLALITEEVGNPCDGGSPDAVALELVDKQAVIHLVECLSKIQDYDISLPSTLQIGRQFFHNVQELGFTLTPLRKPSWLSLRMQWVSKCCIMELTTMCSMSTNLNPVTLFFVKQNIRFTLFQFWTRRRHSDITHMAGHTRLRSTCVVVCSFTDTDSHRLGHRNWLILTGLLLFWSTSMLISVPSSLCGTISSLFPRLTHDCSCGLMRSIVEFESCAVHRPFTAKLSAAKPALQGVLWLAAGCSFAMWHMLSTANQNIPFNWLWGWKQRDKADSDLYFGTSMTFVHSRSEVTAVQKLCIFNEV